VLLSWLFQLFGGPSLIAIRWVQAGVGMLCCVFLLILGRDVGQKHGVSWLGAAAVLLYSLYPTTLLFELDLLTPVWTNALLLGAVVLARSKGLSWWAAAGVGLLMGAAVEMHPTLLIVAGVLFVCLTRLSWVAILGFFAVVLPTLSTNVAEFNSWTLVSHNSGINFYLGNNPRWRTSTFLRPGLPFRQLVLEAEPHRRGAVERNRYWHDRAFSESAALPMVWGAAVLTRVYWSIHNTEVPRNEDYRCRTEKGQLRWLGFLPVRYGWVFPLSMIGAVIQWRAGSRRLCFLWAATHLPMILFIVADRYRLSTWPFLCLLAPLGGNAIYRLVFQRAQHGLSGGWVWLVAGVVGVLPWLPTDKRLHKDPSWCQHVDGNLALMDSNHEVAMSHYRTSVAMDPDNIGAWNYISRIHYGAGEYPQAAEAMAHVLADFPDHFPSLKTMSQIQEKLGNLDQAAEYMGRAYAVPGERTNTGVRYVKLLRAAGRDALAEQIMASNPRLANHPGLVEEPQ